MPDDVLEAPHREIHIEEAGKPDGESVIPVTA